MYLENVLVEGHGVAILKVPLGVHVLGVSPIFLHEFTYSYILNVK